MKRGSEERGMRFPTIGDGCNINTHSCTSIFPSYFCRASRESFVFRIMVDSSSSPSETLVVLRRLEPKTAQKYLIMLFNTTATTILAPHPVLPVRSTKSSLAVDKHTGTYCLLPLVFIYYFFLRAANYVSHTLRIFHPVLHNDVNLRT